MGLRFQPTNRKAAAYLPPSWPFADPTVSLSSGDGGGCCFAGAQLIWSSIRLFLIRLHSSGSHRKLLSHFCISNQNDFGVYTCVFYLLGPETSLPQVSHAFFSVGPTTQEVDGTCSCPQHPVLAPCILTYIRPANALWFHSVAARASKPQETQISPKGTRKKWSDDT